MCRPMFRIEDYTVGWVCALPIELAAATEMLDEEHGDLLLPQDAADNNMYSLGRIGEHNVVIACLPAGLMGTSSAMAVASQMMSKFISIKFGLMVGIGGGVPSTESDIRLGDVVISHPHMQHGGVVQYDFGKAGASGQFTRTGFLNAPPIVLLNAISRFRSNRLRHKSKLLEHLSTIVTRLPHFAATAAGPDILFEPDYDHTAGSTCDKCIKDRMVKRTPRANEEIVVHYGTIASGNQVIKDGMTRDRLSLELGGAILCFEMEAAGLMNNFPCLVIRGICDYADSHKNKKWQPYAAATAAACAKELLSMIPGTEPAKTSKVNDEMIVTDTAPTLDSEEQIAHKNCLDTLFLTNPYDDRAKLINTKGQRVEGTCDWIKNDIFFRSWLNSGSQLLWITGGPGKGKTMLSIYLTEKLAEIVKKLKDTNLIFYFCDHQDEKRNTATAILRGLVYQILEKRPKLFKGICQEFETDKKALYTISSFEAIWRILESVLRDPDLGKIYCVIDGLDECDDGSLRILITKLAGFFQGCSSGPTAGEFKVVAVSRELPRLIMTKLSRFLRLKLDPDADEQVNSDIKRFISVKVDELSVVEGFNARIRAHVEETLLERAEGTFLWVGFVINELLQTDTCTGIVEALASLPKGLPGIYRRILLQINEDRRSIAASILRWVVMALRPLTFAELAAAVNAKPIGYLSSDRVIQDLMGSCGAFIKITKDQVGLIHQSARDYLVREEPDDDTILERFRINQEKANYELARTCLNYIQIEAVSHALINIKNMSHLQQFPLLEYAMLNWPEHARRCADLGKDLFDLSGPFFREESPMLKKWWLWYRMRTSSRLRTPQIFSLLHLASYLGILPLVRKLLAERSKEERFQNIQNEKDGSGRTPLLYAAMYGHEAVVQQLLNNNVEINATGNVGGTALHHAVKIGNKTIVQQLLDSKVDANARDNDGWTALRHAVQNGNKKIVQQLLDGGVDVNAKDNDGMTALHFATKYWKNAIVQQLLDGWADVNAKDNDRMTAIQFTTKYWKNAIVQQLLDGWADVNAKDNDGMTALHLATKYWENSIVQQLVDGGADVNAKNNLGRTALHHALFGGNKAIAQQLLDGKADVNAKNYDGKTALHHAVQDKSGIMVQYLLDIKADVNAQDNYGGTALHLAVQYRDKTMVQQLLDSNADVNVKDNFGKTALYHAVQDENEIKVQQLLDGGADINAKNDLGRTALHLATQYGKEAIVQQLLDGGGNVNAKDNHRRTALLLAVQDGNKTMVQQLPDGGADVNAKDIRGMTALHVAAQDGNEAILQQLLDGGADANAKNDRGRTALDLAVIRDHTAIEKLLRLAQQSKRCSQTSILVTNS